MIQNVKPSDSHQPFCLKGGRIIDPANGRDETGDLHVMEGKIVDPAKIPASVQWKEIPVAGKIVTPGLIDIHVHLREPGQSAKETIGSGTRAAAAGGFTSIVAMPNTNPPVDGPNTIAWLLDRIEKNAHVNVFVTGCISQKMAGELLAPIGSMKKAGIVAITDDGHCIQNNELMRRALEYASMLDLPLFDHCQDYSLTSGGVMNEGYWSTVLGLKGWPALAEEIIVGRNILLAEMTQAKVHCQHLSSIGSVRLIREAKERGVPIYGEVTPHHLFLTDESIKGYNTNFKMNPPTRTKRDQDALKQGIADGTIEILASDHAPHCTYEKEVEFDQAPFGVLGLETELAIYIKTLIDEQVIDWKRMIAMLTSNPAKLLKLNKGTLSLGVDADITVIDPGLEWVIRAEDSLSLSRNTCFDQVPVKGRAVKTFVKGNLIWSI
jgi:dihydroorotase